MAASILLIEDDQNIARLLVIYLGREFTVDHVTTVDDAEKALAGRSYDAAVLDVMLPGRPGWDLIGTLKADHPATRIIITTGRGDAETRQRAATIGADTVLVKPMTPADVKKAIDALLN